jgi:hypothetical protein
MVLHFLDIRAPFSKVGLFIVDKLVKIEVVMIEKEINLADETIEERIPNGTNIVDGNQLGAEVVDTSEAAFLEYCIKYLDTLPDSKEYDRIKSIQEKVNKGDYNFEGHLDRVVDNLVETSEQADFVAYPLFDKI